MILIHLRTTDENLAIEIAELLLYEKLIIDTFQTQGTSRSKNTKGEIILQTEHLVFGKTKALLFDNIEKLIRSKYGDRMPILYSVPIINMDWEQAVELREKTEKI